MVHDGTDGPKFDEILPVPGASGTNLKVTWSEDGSRYAYFGRVGQEYLVMVDGKEVHRGPLSADLVSQGQTPVFQLDFTPGDRHWYLIVQTRTPGRQHYQLVIDGQAGPVSDGDLAPVWSPDGEHPAYILNRNPPTGQPHSSALIVDGKPAPYQAGEPQFTGDGLHLVTKRPGPPRTSLVDVLADGQPFMRVDGGVQLTMAPTGPGVLGVAWTPFQNGVRAAYLLVSNRKVPGSECTDNAAMSPSPRTAGRSTRGAATAGPS